MEIPGKIVLRLRRHHRAVRDEANGANERED
jgi:hypothetical protein